MLAYWTIHHDIAIPLYNLWVGIGLIGAFLYLETQLKKYNVSDGHSSSIYISLCMAILTGFMGAFGFDALTHYQVTDLSNVGLTFYGGFLSGLMVLCLFIKIFHMETGSTLNLLTPAFILSHAFGRIGCFFAGCCYGKPTLLPWGMVFPSNSLPAAAFGNAPLHPTQLYEAIFLFAIFFIMHKQYIPCEQRAFQYMAFYAIFRFFLEYLRADDRGMLWNQTIVSPSQTVSVIVIVITVLIYFRNRLATGRAKID